ncbi:MAG: T9SS type A sorting domain-containing protein [Flavobacteriales bacterium]|nr:T9SS type A sorting domain-containing protein [Flavobacteriales bacterium]
MGFRCSLVLVLAACLATGAMAQCPNDNTLTGVAVTPPCPGSTTVPCVQGGQYALVNVVAGNTYTFSTCAATFDTQITLFNNAGGGSMGYNDDACGTGLQSSVTWVATFTGQLRVLVDQYNCASNTTCAPLLIACTPPPSGDCVYTLTLSDSFSDGWGTSFVTITINGVPTNYTVPAGVPSVTVQIGVNIGDAIVISYNASGAFQTDNAYTLALGGGTIFNSGTPPAAGVVYAGSVTCVPPPPAPEDCLGAVTICSNVAFSNNTTNTGNIVDINAANSGCLDIVEYQGTWYVFSPSSSGDLGLTIAPLGPDDYDWAIWGPYPPGSTPSGICPPAGPPIRCAASSGPATFNSTGSYATGMGHPTYSPPQFASTLVTYGLPATLNICPLVLPQYCGWVPGMQVNVGEVYLLYISNWSQSSIGFELDWNLQNGASLDCTVLPVELLSLQAYAVTGGVHVDWTTATEIDNDRFEIERALDGEHFEHIGTMPGAGNSLQTLYYTFLDPHPHHGINYYRLRQVDHNGDHAYSPVRTVQFGSPVGEVRMVPNPGSSFVDVLWPQVEPGSLLVMHDATGREVSRVHLEAPRTTIDVSSLSRGVYGSHVQLPSGEHSSPVVWVRE